MERETKRNEKRNDENELPFDCFRIWFHNRRKIDCLHSDKFVLRLHVLRQ